MSCYLYIKRLIIEPMGEIFNNKLILFKKQFGKKQFTYSDVISKGISHVQFYSLVKSKVLERVQKGIYRFNDYLPLSIEEQLRDATQFVSNESAICLSSALSFYGLTDAIILKPWLLVDQSVSSRSKKIQLFRKRDPKWNVGIEKKKGFKITSLERTLVETIAYRNTLTGYDGVYALRKAIFDNKVRLQDLFKIAKKLEYGNRVNDILEAYLDEGE